MKAISPNRRILNLSIVTLINWHYQFDVFLIFLDHILLLFMINKSSLNCWFDPSWHLEFNKLYEFGEYWDVELVLFLILSYNLAKFFAKLLQFIFDLFELL